MFRPNWIDQNTGTEMCGNRARIGLTMDDSLGFWESFFLLLIFIPLVLIWIFALVDIFRRDDMRHVDVEIVKRSDAAKGFTVLPKRWIVIPTFGPDRAAAAAEILNVMAT